MSALFLVALIAPWVSAPIVWLLGQKLKARTGFAALVAPFISFGACLALVRGQGSPEFQNILSWQWVPSLGVNLTFRLDPLALFFALIVSGVGCLVILYAVHYLNAQYKNHASFYCVLQLFMGAMLATVFSSNLIVLFTAWELTGITSFFLIGFFHERESSQRGARMALLTTSGSGLALLAGLILLGGAYGSFELETILSATPQPSAQPQIAWAFIGCFIGICGKSALFPLHYWLPNAMSAPTPVSAYLHSATMVKLGVFLTARLLPVFSDTSVSGPHLMSVGFMTFLFGAAAACRYRDLKAILAFTTLAQLGLLIGQYAWAKGGSAAYGDTLHILNHTLYKACLFMVVGLIDHSAGTRDITKLGGLSKRLPLLTAIGLVGLAAMAGLPLTSGFISKELLLATAIEFSQENTSILSQLSLGALVMGSVLHGYLALYLAKRVFFGEIPKELSSLHAPSLSAQLSPLLLAAGILFLGIAPAQLQALLQHLPTGLSASQELALWHGATPAAQLSLVVYVSAGALFWIKIRREIKPETSLRGLPRLLEFDRFFDAGLSGLYRFGRWLDAQLGFQTPSKYLFIVTWVLALTLGSAVFFARASILETLSSAQLLPASAEGYTRYAATLLICAGAIAAAAWKKPISQLFAVSLVGIGIAFYYVLYRAPDLALTQLLVEAATLLLVLLIALRFKRQGAEWEPIAITPRLTRSRRVLLASVLGGLLGLFVLVFQGSAPRAGEFYLKQTLPLAQGRNGVNTIVVDFRGFDTLLEISVLLIAALGCLGLLSRTGWPNGERPPHPVTNLFPIPNDSILKSVGLGLFIPLNLFAVYIFLRGHNAPGGGFVAGLITALSLLLLAFALGLQEFSRKLKVEPLRLAASGVLLAILVALLPLYFGYSPLHHMHKEILGVFVSTTLFFDLGVFLAVVGVTLKLLLPLIRSAHGLAAFSTSEEGRLTAQAHEPIDYDPARGASSNQQLEPYTPRLNGPELPPAPTGSSK